MKRFLLILVLGLTGLTASADHITGGEMYYNYISTSGGANIYMVTLKLFMRCNSGRQFPNPIYISAFDKGSNSRVSDVSQAITQQETLRLTNTDPCITDPPSVCYEVAYYTFAISLPISTSGYILAAEVNYRISGISNIRASQVGATYTCEIPGTAHGGVPVTQNSSANFKGSDLVVVCADNYFTYSFAASDANNDRIRYSFCSAYNSTSGNINGAPAGFPPYSSLNYLSPAFDASHPLGQEVSIDPETGLISGVAPPPGIYVVTVCAEEIRDNKIIATQRKDLQIHITDCSIASARLEKDYMLCRTTRDINIRNLSNSPLIVSYLWTVAAPNGDIIHTSNATELQFTFPANGVYSVKLVVNKDKPCSDSTTAPVFVFPGMTTSFMTQGICITKPTVFRDQSSTPNGTITTWKWDFGEQGTSTDVATIRNPTYTYPSLGTKQIVLTVTESNGCRDTANRTITIINEPPIMLAFRDTLICLNDQLPLLASGQGIFSWSPVTGMVNANSATPTVTPTQTTKYYVELDADGCVNRDSVLVRVVDHVSMALMPDTVICSADTIRIRTNSDALQFTWTPANQLVDATVKDPIAITPETTIYNVTGVIGGCTTSQSVTVAAVPYPLAALGEDTTICYNTSAQLLATTNATSWTWSPPSTVSNTGILNPFATPARSTEYIFTAYRLASGCPKPTRDTMLVNVLPKIIPYAGADTAVITGQPLQLEASGGVEYVWSPAFYLSAVDISNPVAIFQEPAENIRLKVLVYNEVGCFDSSFVSVKVYSTLPSVFVPTAFTPNNDGRNDLLFPTAVGIKQIQFFSIYNRWGQLVFTTRVNGHGWDGRINGQLQATNTYVWVVRAIDYLGKAYQQKGTVTLIR